MPVSELLAARGTQSVAIQPLRHELILIEVPSGAGRTAWVDPQRALWSASVDPTSTQVALLTSSLDAAIDWSVDFLAIAGGIATPAVIGNQHREGEVRPDVVAGGRGGIAWLPDSSSVAVSMPTGGLLQVFPDGSDVRLAKASAAKRPAAIAVSQDGGAVAFVDQPSGSDGSGIMAGSLRAKPIDPIVVLPADRSGNRYAREVEWIGSTDQVATIIDREELGEPQGDLFSVDTRTKAPSLVWTSPAGRDIASVESFAIAPDGFVVAFLTNPSRTGGDKPSSLWLKQLNGPTIERFDLPIGLTETRIAFSPSGVVVTGLHGQSETSDGQVAAFLLQPNGEITVLYEQVAPATPVASPIASPIASPEASPEGSPFASPQAFGETASPSPASTNGA
jgi:hypothetical protein